MFKEIVQILRCPMCGEVLELIEKVVKEDDVIEGYLLCLNNHKWEIRDGVLDFCSEEQTFGNN